MWFGKEQEEEMEDKRGEKDNLHKKHVRVSACACICLCMCGEKEGGGVFTWRQQGWLIRKSALLANGF